MDLSIIIVSWNTRDLLLACLRSVYATIDNLKFEVFVVDNGSSDGSVESVRQAFPAVHLIENRENRGFAGANNQGIQVSVGRYVLLLNSDAELLPNAATSLVRFLDNHPATGIAGGMLLNPDGSFQSSYADFPGLLAETLLLTGLWRWLRPPSYPCYPEEQSREAREVDWVVGAFLLARREAIDQIGPLDEDYFMYSEEVDWCYRMKRGGWAIAYRPEARVLHAAGGTSRRVPERKRAQIYHSKWLFQKKHRGAWRALLFRSLVTVLSAAKLVVWFARGALASGEIRRRANQNVVAYRYLLANF